MGFSFGEHVGQTAQLVLELIPRINVRSPHGQQLVAFAHARFFGRSVRHHTVNLGRNEGHGEFGCRLNHVEQVQVARQCDAHGFSVAYDVGPASFRERTEHVGPPFFELALFGAKQNVVVLKSQCLGLLVELHAHGHVARADELVAPGEEHHGIDEQSQQEVHQHAANHDEQPLPCRFGAELPRLCRLFHLFNIEALVNHACNFAVAA